MTGLCGDDAGDQRLPSLSRCEVGERSLLRHDGDAVIHLQFQARQVQHHGRDGGVFGLVLLRSGAVLAATK